MRPAMTTARDTYTDMTTRMGRNIRTRMRMTTITGMYTIITTRRPATLPISSLACRCPKRSRNRHGPSMTQSHRAEAKAHGCPGGRRALS